MHQRGLSDPRAVPEEAILGQYIPLHYHGIMLLDQARTAGFQAAINHVVKPGSRVLELGGGLAVLSYFAAQHAAHVWCVERNPELLDRARELLVLNRVDERVELVAADAFDFLPPEPVQVVICEMLHVGLLREKQIAVLASFKERYLARFGPPLPMFIPQATILGLQPVEHPFLFSGYHAPMPLFQDAAVADQNTRELAAPLVTHSIIYEQPLPNSIAWSGEFTLTTSGSFSAVRLITRNILAVRLAQGDTIDWYMQHMLMPLDEPLAVQAGDRLRVVFEYAPGAELRALADSLRVSLL